MLRLVYAAALFAILPLGLCADTVEFIRGGSVNGVVTMQGDKVTIRTEFAQGGKRETVVERRFISSIENNDKASNAGAVPSNWGVFQPSEAEHFEMATVDVLLLADGSRERGRVEAITASSIRFNGEDIPRGEVKMVLLGSAVLVR